MGPHLVQGRPLVVGAGDGHQRLFHGVDAAVEPVGALVHRPKLALAQQANFVELLVVAGHRSLVQGDALGGQFLGVRAVRVKVQGGFGLHTLEGFPDGAVQASLGAGPLLAGQQHSCRSERVDVGCRLGQPVLGSQRCRPLLHRKLGGGDGGGDAGPGADRRRGGQH